MNLSGWLRLGQEATCWGRGVRLSRFLGPDAFDPAAAPAGRVGRRIAVSGGSVGEERGNRGSARQAGQRRGFGEAFPGRIGYLKGSCCPDFGGPIGRSGRNQMHLSIPA
jgi:hypothetical protein